MILLEPTNRIIADTLTSRLESLDDKPDSLDIQLADFDGVLYHLSTPVAENRHIITVSMSVKCYKSELAKYGVGRIMAREYGSFLAEQPEPGFDVTIEFQEDQIAPEDRADLVNKIALLKTNAMSAPFEAAFEEILAQTKKSEMMAVHYRDQEALYVKSAADRVTVIFSVLFRDETDKIMAKVFLQEFVDCRRQQSLQNAPQVLYTSKDPPMELRGRSDVQELDNVGYVTFVLFPRHFEKPAQRTATVQLIQYFRDYLHYHIKCSKAYLHSRMRAKVESWLKVINRAKPESEKEKKTASGKVWFFALTVHIG